MDFDESYLGSNSQGPVTETFKSFRDAVSSPEASTEIFEDWLQPLSEEEANMPLDADTENPDCPVIECSRGEHRLANCRLKDAVIFHVLGRRVPFAIMNNRIQNLWAVRGQIGKLVRIDPTTIAMERGNYAWICVRVDLSKKLLSKYKLLHRVRRVEYEGLHVVCFKCGIYGHTTDICPTAAVAAVKDGEQVHSNPLFLEKVLAKEIPEVFEEYGPWMLAKSRSKRNVGAPNKTVSRPIAPTLGHPGPPPPLPPPPPQGSRLLVNETPPAPQIPQSTAVELVSSTPSGTTPQVGIQSGSKKQKPKKGAGLSPEGETNSANTTGKRASKSAIQKVDVSASTKGKGSSQ
ncbi:hypothetical protein LINPERHAP2_LOCUS7342, partial [Linum perenne]